jgi:hypothetical protein
MSVAVANKDEEMVESPQSGVARSHPSAPSLVLRVFPVMALLLVATPHAMAQGCAMCYQNATSSGSQGRLALRHGILILLLPALSLFLAIFVLICRRRDPS